jgi:gliding motility-associated protein GldM
MSGAKNCPETPRQKMIAMMYLFLTAMLALNVSADILNGFVLVNNSLLQTIKSSNDRNIVTISKFQSLEADNPKKIKEWLDKALVVKQKSDSMYQYLENFKYSIVRLADGKDATLKDIRNKDNLDVTGQYGLVEGNGKILRNKLIAYRNFLSTMVNGDTSQIAAFDRNFSTNNGKDGKNWEETIFEMMPVVASVTVLSKYQADVKAAEGEVIRYLMAQTDVSDFRVNKLQAYVIPTSTYVMVGDQYNAQIILSAVDSTKVPTYYVNGHQLPTQMFKFVCNQPGEFNYKGYIRLNSGGINRDFPFESNYIVGAKSATISNTALNVVYAGIDNELSASVPGVAASNVQVSCSNAVLTRKANGMWNCRPTITFGKIVFSLAAKMEGNKNFVPMGNVAYTVRQLPDPRPFFQYKDAGGVERKIVEGNVTLSMLNNGTVVADYVNELISANFTVIGFTIEYPNGEEFNSDSNRLTTEQKNRLAEERVGSRIIIKKIRAVGPDKLVRQLPILAVKIIGR